MKKVLVIGCCGAGKSTFSRKLHNIINLELIHLDQYYHKPNWEEPEKREWEGIVNNLVQKLSWIMDGNYKGTFDIRFKEADTIIYLDYSTLKCLWRVIKRIIKNSLMSLSDVRKYKIIITEITVILREPSIPSK